MSSAEGQVQNLKYKATFPLLLNIGGEPTYFIALKDGAGLVKKYAMVNVQKYQVVAVGDTVNECEKEYQKQLLSKGITTEAPDEREEKTIEGTITKIAQAVVDGNSHYYLMLSGSEDIYDVSVAEHLNIIKYEVGQNIKLRYKEAQEAQQVTEIEE